MTNLERVKRLQSLIDLKKKIDAEIEAMRKEAEELDRVARDAMTNRRDLCGTESGYSAHRRRGEDTCSACRRARADGEARRARARRERSQAA